MKPPVDVTDPLGMTTTTSLAPSVPAGEVAMTRVAETYTNPVAVTPPKVTPVALVKFVPSIVTVVPPVVAPTFGVIPFETMVGTAA